MYAAGWQVFGLFEKIAVLLASRGAPGQQEGQGLFGKMSLRRVSFPHLALKSTMRAQSERLGHFSVRWRG